MIHPDVLFEHVDIHHARRFVDLSMLAQPNPRVLYVLHDQGKVLKAWDSQKGKVSLGATVAPSKELAEELRKKYQVEEVQLIEREAYHAYLRQALDLKKAEELNGYDYKAWAKGLKNGQGNGFLIHPPREHYEYYHYVDRTRQFVAQKLKPDCVFLLGAYDTKDWWVSLVTVFEKGLITYLSTFELFPAETLSPADSPQTQGALLEKSAKQFQKPAFGMFLSRSDFEAFGKKQWRGLGKTPLVSSPFL